MKIDEQIATAERLATYVPDFLRRRLRETTPAELRRWSEHAEMACLFADVSGFTPLVEALAARGKEGLEQLRGVMTRIFGPLVQVTRRWGGDALRFAGDAMTAVFPNPLAPKEALFDAALCALELRATMDEVLARLPKGLPPLGLKVGLGFGPMSLALVGDAAMALAIGGAALTRAVAAEHSLSRGEIGVWQPDEVYRLDSLSALRALRPKLSLPPLPTGSRDAVPGGSRAEPWPAEPSALPLLPERLLPFLLEPIAQRILSGATDLLYEHRQLRVIFFNFSGVGLDSSEELARLDHFYTEAHAAVRRHGGFVSELDMGDKGANLIAFFGAPAAVERPWRAAGKAALELMELCRTQGLAAKAGLASGRVFCGEQGAPGQRLQYGVFGEAINRSARLMSKAAAGEVLVDPFFAAEAAGVFELEALAPVALKGFTQPVVLSRLGAELAGGRGAKGSAGQGSALDPPGPASLDPVGRGGMLGREEERSRLLERWQMALQGRGSAVALVGPPGIGKSRLAEELARFAAAQGALVLVGAGRQESSGVPLEGLREALEPIVGRGGGDAEPLVQRILALEPDAPRLGADPAVLLQAALAVLDRWLDRRAAGQPILLLVEDIAWLDSASLELLRDQARGARGRRQMLLLTAREGLAFEEEIVRKLEIGPLPKAEALELARLALGAKLLDRELEQLLGRLGHGNPLMLGEICRHLRSTGMVTVSPYGQAHLSRKVDEEMPGSLEALMLARLDRLPARARRLVQAACCLGPEFAPELLGRITGAEAAEVEAQLAPALEAGLLRRADGGTHCRFEPPLLREIIHGALSRADRRRLHERAAKALEALDPTGVAVPPARLAYHYDLAGRKKAAYQYTLAAARLAQSQGALAEALQHYGRAIELGRDDLPELLTRSAELSFALGHPDAALDAAQRLSRLASRRHAAQMRIQAGLLLASAQAAKSRYPDALATARQAFEQARASHDQALETEALVSMGYFSLLQGQFQQAEAWLEEGLQQALALDNPKLAAESHRQLGSLCIRTSQLTRGLGHFEHALEVFRQLADFDKQLRCLNNLAIINLHRAPEQSEAWAQEALDRSRKIGSKTGEASALETLADSWMRRGRLEDAERLFRQAIATFHRAGDAGGLASCTNNLAMILHLNQRLDDAEPLYLEALSIWQRTGNTPLVCIAMNNLAELYEDRRENERSSTAYRQSLEMARQAKNPDIEAKALLGLARLTLLQQQLPEAREHAQAALEVARRAGLAPLHAQAEEFLRRNAPP